MSLRTLIVDDEPLALDLLRILLLEHKDIEIVEACTNGLQAIRILRSRRVDLLFLDVQMPKITGFDLIEQIGLQYLPTTVFVTAYHEHAVRAFDVQAVDYLTKPVEAERLAKALERVRNKLASDNALLTHDELVGIMTEMRTRESLVPYASRLLVRDREKELLLAVDKIDWVEAADYYCCLHSGGHIYMVRETISDLSQRMDPRQFVRIHRSVIVNLDRIGEIQRGGTSQGAVRLADGQVVRMSKAGRDRLLAAGKI